MNFLLRLRGQVLGIFALALLIVLAMVLGFWRSEEATQRQVLALSNEAIKTLAKETLLRRGQQLAAHVALTLAAPMAVADSKAVAVSAQATSQQPDVKYVIVYDRSGRIIDAGTDYGARGQPMVDPLADAALSSSSMKLQWSDDLLDVSAPVIAQGQRIGGVRIGLVSQTPGAAQQGVFAPLNLALEQARRQQKIWLIGGLLLLIVLGSAIAALIEWRMLQPIRDIGRLMNEQGPVQDEPLPHIPEREDEIGDLMRALARMRAGVAKHARDLRRMAYTDPLTGLANRLSFRETLDSRLMTLQASSGELALLFIDLDDFKRVNDTLGHEAGDEVLSQLSVRVRMALERLGAYGNEIARFGGDEFIVLYQANDIRAASASLAEALTEEIKRPLLLRGQQVFLGASIGITLFPYDATHASPLLKNADIAMYQAKTAGKNCYRFYSRAMDQAVESRMQLEQDLRGAWGRGEMTVVYQPLFYLSDGRIIGAEALLRWQHPRLGILSPAGFIEVAEQSDLIDQLGRHVLEQACRDAAAWPDKNALQPFVSVNISSCQLRNGDLPDVVSHALRSSGLAAQQLHLELTETAVLSDEAQASALLSRVRATGVRVWLDDFGTGFSGLSHLRRVPVDGVKIDRSFIADVLRDPDDLALTSAIIAMGHSLGMTVVAEGIESEGQYAILRERGCDLGQGFWLGRPMTSAEMAARLQG